MNAQDLLPPILELEQDSDPHLEAVAELEEVAQHLDLEDWIVNRLRHTERETAVNLPITRDDGRSGSFTGYRVQHLSSRGSTLGSVAISPTAHISDLRAAAMHATWQAELFALPFGGAAGALVCNADDLSERELRQLAKDYVHSLRGMVGRFTDVLTPGPGCNEQTMAWMLDSHAHTQGHMELGVITGKPALMWGLPDTDKLTADGAVKVLEEVCARTGSKLKEQRVSIQGFGTLGSAIARALYESGACIVAVADISGGLYNESGIDIPALQKHAAEKRVIFGFREASEACNADILEADCGILVMAATERQITAVNAERIKAPVVLEARRRALTRSGEAALVAKGTTVVPEIMASAGAIIAAFLEWSQSVRFSTLAPADVEKDLGTRVGAACQAVFTMATRNDSSLREAANVIAVNRIAGELRLRK